MIYTLPVQGKVLENRTLFILLGLFCCLLLVFLYNYHFYDSFFPWTEGWFSMYAYELNHGKQLYRDIYYFMPPLYPKLIEWYTAVFGYDIVTLRILGLFVILVFSTCLYFIFLQFTSIIGASIITVLVTVYYQYSNAHIPYDFIQFMNLGLLISCLGAIWTFKLDERPNPTLKFVAICCSGFFLSNAALIKQSNGGVVGLLTFLMMSAFIFRTLKSYRLQAWAFYVVGCSLPFLFMLLDLIGYQSAGLFIQQAFTGALAAKGDTNQIIFGWIPYLYSSEFFVQSKDIFNVSILTGGILFLIFPNLWNSNHQIAILWKSPLLNTVATILLASALIVVFFISLYTSIELPSFLKTLYDHGHIFFPAAIVSPFIFCFFSFRFLKGPQKRIGLFLGLYSIFLIIGNGTSAGISEAGTFLGLGLGLILLLNVPSVLKLNYLLFIPILVLISFSIREKNSVPYSWWKMTVPLNNNEPIYDHPILAGMRLNAEQLEVIKSVNLIVAQYSKSDSDVLAFPHIPIFYLLNNKRIPTHAVVHWFDFLPDNLAIREANDLTTKELRVIIELDLGEDVWQAHERLFRGNQLSGQRHIQGFIAERKRVYNMTTRVINFSNDTRLLISFY